MVKQNIISTFNNDFPFFRSVPKKEPELLEGHVTRHLACAFVAFLDRQTSLENVDKDDVEQMNVAKEAIKKAFKLPEDDSLKVFFYLKISTCLLISFPPSLLFI